MSTRKPGAATKSMVLSILLLSSNMSVHAGNKLPKEGDDWWSTHMGAGVAKKPKAQSPKERCEARAKDQQGQARDQVIDRCVARASKPGK